MSQKQERIRSLSGKISIVLKLGLAAANVIGILALIAIGILLFSGGDVRASFLAAFRVTANNGTTIGIKAGQLLLMFVFMLADAVLISLAIFFIHAVFAEMKSGSTPFSKENTVRIKKTAIVVSILSIVGGCSDALVDYYTIGGLTWRVNIVGLITAVIIYCISLIFGYGCDLQRESDETL